MTIPVPVSTNGFQDRACNRAGSPSEVIDRLNVALENGDFKGFLEKKKDPSDRQPTEKGAKPPEEEDPIRGAGRVQNKEACTNSGCLQDSDCFCSRRLRVIAPREGSVNARSTDQ